MEHLLLYIAHTRGGLQKIVIEVTTTRGDCSHSRCDAEHSTLKCHLSLLSPFIQQEEVMILLFLCCCCHYYAIKCWNAFCQVWDVHCRVDNLLNGDAEQRYHTRLLLLPEHQYFVRDVFSLHFTNALKKNGWNIHHAKFNWHACHNVSFATAMFALFFLFWKYRHLCSWNW